MPEAMSVAGWEVAGGIESQGAKECTNNGRRGTRCQAASQLWVMKNHSSQNPISISNSSPLADGLSNSARAPYRQEGIDGK